MKGILRAYSIPTIQLVSAIGIAICSIWFGTWYSSGAKQYQEFAEENLSETPPSEFWTVTSYHSSNFASPVPYTTLTLLFGILGGVGAFRNHHKINKYNELEKTLRVEKGNHGETQKNYNGAIGYIIESIFVHTNDEFDRDCRITIYRHTNDNQFKKIFRHAGRDQFNSGRVRIPDNEGVVGAAWANDGIAHVCIDPKRGTQAFDQQMSKALGDEGSRLPTARTRMPSQEYFAMAIRDHSRIKIAVVVLESTKNGVFSKERLTSLIMQENYQIATYIQHKGKLDEILNPDGDLDNG